MTKNQLIEKILLAFSANYDIEKNQDSSQQNLIARCNLNIRSAKYFASKKMELWAVNTNEYLYLFNCENLDENNLNYFIKLAEDEGFAKVKPNSEHMATYISIFIITNNCNLSTSKLIKKYKKRKSYLFSFHGWAEVCISALIIQKENNQEIEEFNFINNRSGKVITKSLEKILSKLKSGQN